MIIKDAKKQIKEVWLKWNNNDEKFGDHFALTLHGWLQHNRPELLSFRCKGDKYQRIPNPRPKFITN